VSLNGIVIVAVL